jgi:hypothetical protein
MQNTSLSSGTVNQNSSSLCRELSSSEVDIGDTLGRLD